jgi:hypothetical protein
MPKWAKFVLRAIGILNITLVSIGSYWLVSSIRRGLAGVGAAFPHFGTVFGVMTAINVLFLGVFLVTAVQLIRCRLSAVVPYSIAMAAVIVYDLLLSGLWTVPGIGRSVAAATGIGNMGIALFELLLVIPYAYPILSATALILTMQFAIRERRNRIAVD